MGRGDVLSLLVVLFYVQPLCVWSSRNILDTSNHRLNIADAGRRSILPLLENVSGRLSFLVSVYNDVSRSNQPSTYKLKKREQKPLSEINFGAMRDIEAETRDNDESWDSQRLPVWRPDYEFLPRKRQVRNCDTSRITLQTLIEYLRTGKICGRRVAHVRFGLGGRR